MVVMPCVASGRRGPIGRRDGHLHGQAHEASRESEKRYRRSAENVTDFIWIGEIAGLKNVAEWCSGY